MSEPRWPRRPPPAPDRGGALLGRWQPTGLLDVTTSRRQLSAALNGDARPPHVREGAVERLLLAFEELVSNGLRHGREPVEVTVTTFDDGWLLQVTDTATDTPPIPAVGRDPSQGGLGLHLVARITAAHGWTVDGTGRKVVWARGLFTRDEAPPTP